MTPMLEAESFAEGVKNGEFYAPLDNFSRTDTILLKNYYETMEKWEDMLGNEISPLGTSTKVIIGSWSSEIKSELEKTCPLRLNAEICGVAGLAFASAKEPRIANKFGFQAVCINKKDVLLTPKEGKKIRLAWEDGKNNREFALALAGTLMVLWEKQRVQAGENGLLIADCIDVRGKHSGCGMHTLMSVAVCAYPSGEGSGEETNLKLTRQPKPLVGASDDTKPILVMVDFRGRF